MSTASVSIEQLAINTIRTLSMDAVQKANSGHPGTPMALAPVGYTIWNEVLKYDPADPVWPCRDRFVLSCGHASMLLYSLLHLAGVKQVDHAGQVLDEPAVPLEQIKLFRQWGSRTPGHPEYGDTGGVETTTGPLGQGCGNSVGMAIAQRWLAAHYSRPGFEDLFDWNVYVLCSDGDLMEGVSNEAASIAGHLKLSNLLWIYDNNHITIEGETKLAFSEDVATRFEGLGWTVTRVDDANDLGAIRRAIEFFHKNNDTPTMIVLSSHIGYGSPHKQDTHDAHGAPLGEEEIKLTKKFYGWPEDAKFLVPEGVREHFAEGIGRRGAAAHAAWKKRSAEYRGKHADLAAQWDTMQARGLPKDWDAKIPTFPADTKGMATRASSGKVLNALGTQVPWLIGGSADLAPSTKTLMEYDGAGSFEAESYNGRNFHWGIREHGMAAALNGMALSRVRPYGATFFIFSDYLRPSMRLAALIGLPTIYVLTHDSIGLGEDGPTHQPVEHLAACRAIPRLVVLRPGDANEVAEAYRAVMQFTDRPALLALSRQNVPTIDRSKYNSAAGTAKGAYVLADAAGGKPEAIVIGTGTEVPIALAAYETLTAEGVKVRVVSMPSWELFDEQDQAYRDSVLPLGVTARVAVEAGIEQGWEKYLGPQGRFVGLSTFGASAPYQTIYRERGLTPEHVAAEVKAALGR